MTRQFVVKFLSRPITLYFMIDTIETRSAVSEFLYAFQTEGQIA
jgi:hypothetical protein